MVNLNEIKQEPIINYPTFWEYKVILKSHILAKEIFEELLVQREYKYQHSHSSKNGKYQSYLLSVFVNSKKDRLDIFERLKAKAQFVL
ncbi:MULTISPECIES: DUF493 domain-containing protein [unclassified Campylobacter]|uniref:HP0495 family protein n=1 Tax=unclassified Campylobacter TaxID=2593542 RepID=UPI0012380949|nr:MULTISPECIES: DUF493 domain-containing protein [unclassified Campylobacter]KAA6227219.1 DUF493 domain-containing protein [Campylobacter sp. LR286c]KAA6227907.1 DUF493 domain-containing protein [Campylobacter sp. LR185c]KAA6228316.1 DUF493 domain-containing protein [Campylobacter sp. LR196d]KAA6229317.1 DUF493 domain-containing protein [Campylobacter sp. LR291e]KAA6231123.1 DUF493 domain-containing protein [Campylobacter sp. LR264d]